MAKKYGWLDRGKNESADSYDSRINHLAAFHAGYAFFSRDNYDPEYAAFSVYLLWNGEFNSKVEPALPDGGFMIHCSPDVAERFTSYEMGLPVYVKISSSEGKIYAENMTVADHKDFYDLYFNGCEVKKPELLYYARRRDAEDCFEDEDDICREICPGAFIIHGSYQAAIGSYQSVKGGYKPANGSYGSANGSYQSVYGSYNLISFAGSGVSGGNNLFQLGSYLRGSYLWNFNNNNNNNNAGSAGFLSSFNLRSLWSGFLSGSGSFIRTLLGGSYQGISGIYGSGYKNRAFGYGSYGYGSFGGSFTDPHVYRPDLSLLSAGRDNDGDDNPNKAMINGIRPAESNLDFIPRSGRFMPSYRMIAEMGYGLDLI
ncbi:MAG: hypothetical protein K6C99_06700 [Lachnospiraceae bacterium]|nr:hypothetical protein [Lachnospiraceae bacterium]